MKEKTEKMEKTEQIKPRETMSIVFVGHVDHGKSTVLGRLLADTGSLPKGKLEQVKEECKRTSKTFEYAFLIDALKDERAQGVTIDSARCFFKGKKRNYNIIDAPGHVDFLKNMISGAARAEAALLVIDAQEGVQENSKRHGYLLSMLGIKQVIVCVNKMDLVGYDEKVFIKIKKEYQEFLKQIGVEPKTFIPMSALKGDNIAKNTPNLSWFKGECVLTALDSFEKSKTLEQRPFRMPVQDVYKFTDKKDSRRIVAGRIESGSINVGDTVVFLPSNKQTQIKSIVEFSSEPRKRNNAVAGYSEGFTLKHQIYLSRGEIMCKQKEDNQEEDNPLVSSMFKANIFWMGKNPLILGKEYKLKITTMEVPVRIDQIIKIIDASELSKLDKKQIDKHEVAECIFKCSSPIAFDLFSELQATGRFVVVDDYDIAGGGIITEFVEDDQAKIREQVLLREKKWDQSFINPGERSQMYGQYPCLVLITGLTGIDKKTIAKNLEKRLFASGRKVYFIGIRNILRGLDADIGKKKREEHVRRLGEVAHILLDAGLIVVATASDLTEEEIKLLQTVNSKDLMLIVNVGENRIKRGLDLRLNADEKVDSSVDKILDLLKTKKFIFGFN